jgi:hypothetical protein
MRTRGGKADLQDTMVAAPRMENDASASVAMAVDQWSDRRIDT